MPENKTAEGHALEIRNYFANYQGIALEERSADMPLSIIPRY